MKSTGPRMKGRTRSASPTTTLTRSLRPALLAFDWQNLARYGLLSTQVSLPPRGMLPAMRMAEYPTSEPTSMPWVGSCRARRRLMTRPFSRPMTGMCHSVTARSMSRSIFSARLVITGAVPRSSGGGHPCLDTVGKGIAPVPLARLDDLAGQRASHDLLHALRHGDERVQVDPSLHSHGPQAVHEIFRAHVAGGAGGEGAAPEPADGGVEVAHAHLHGGEDVRDGHGARVVGVERPLDAGEAG